MPDYHVHVYKIKGMYEVNLNSPNAEMARRDALAEVKEKKCKLVPADNNFIAIAFLKAEEK